MADKGAQHRRVKTALDETRLLILGAEILFGFHLNGAFQSGFAGLAPPCAARRHCGGPAQLGYHKRGYCAPMNSGRVDEVRATPAFRCALR